MRWGWYAGVWALMFGLVLAACDDELVVEDIEPGQTESEPCNPEHEIDACGAGLFCAAFEGREIPTCYRLRSRQSGESCRKDNHCITDNCNKNKCGLAPSGAPCASDAQCSSGSCGFTTGTCD